ncbi:MAG: hypothetical protein KAJ23_13160 [Maribacter sp.]|nr:hypothetical protein [Maribacter sp.]
MKKIILVFALLIGFAVSAQDTYYTTYSFVVEPQNDATIFKLVDDFYSKNKPEGVFVRLFENHFKDAGNKATHQLVFSGTQEAVGNMYGGGPNDTFALFLTRLNQHIKESAGSAMGRNIAFYGESGTRYPAQRVLLLDVEDTNVFDEAYNKFHSKHNPPGVLVYMGTSITGQGVGKANRWAIIGYKDIKTAIGGRNKLLTGAALKAREKAWANFIANNGGVTVVGSGMRILLGAW